MLALISLLAMYIFLSLANVKQIVNNNNLQLLYIFSNVQLGLVTVSENKGVIPTSCIHMLMDVGIDLDFIKLFGLLL